MNNITNQTHSQEIQKNSETIQEQKTNQHAKSLDNQQFINLSNKVQKQEINLNSPKNDNNQNQKQNNDIRYTDQLTNKSDQNQSKGNEQQSQQQSQQQQQQQSQQNLQTPQQIQRKFSGVLQQMQNFSGKFESQSKKDETILAYLLQNLDSAFDEDDNFNSEALKDYFKSLRGQKDILQFLHDQQSIIKDKMEYFKVEICVLIHKQSKRDLMNVQQYLHKKLQSCKLDLVFAGKKQGKVLTNQMSSKTQNYDKKQQIKTQIEDYLVHIPYHELNEAGIKPIQNIDDYDAFYFQGTQFIPKQYLRSIPQAENNKYILFLNSEPYNHEAKNALNIPYLKNIIYIKQSLQTQVPDIINLDYDDVYIYIYNCQYCRQQGNQDLPVNNSQMFTKYQGPLKCDKCENIKQVKKYYVFKHNLLGVENDSLDYKYYNLHRPENIEHMIKFACGCLNKDKFSDEKNAGSLIIGIKDQPPIGMNNRVVCQGLDLSDTDFEHLKNSLHQKVEKHTTIYHQDPSYIQEQLSEQVFNNHFELNKCEVVHYDRKKNCLSELFMYMPEERKFSKKCIIEFHVKRIQVKISDPVVFYLPKGKRDKQIFCQRVLDSTSKTEEFKNLKDFQHRHPQKQVLHHDGKINFVLPEYLKFDYDSLLCFYKAIPQTQQIKELQDEIAQLKQLQKDTLQKLFDQADNKDDDDNDDDDKTDKSDSSYGLMPGMFNDSHIVKRQNSQSLKNQLSLTTIQHYDDDDKSVFQDNLNGSNKNENKYIKKNSIKKSITLFEKWANYLSKSKKSEILSKTLTTIKKTHSIQHKSKNDKLLQLVKHNSSSELQKHCYGKNKNQKQCKKQYSDYSEQELKDKLLKYQQKQVLIQQQLKKRYPQSIKSQIIEWLKVDPLSKILFLFTVISFLKFRNKLK